MQPHAQPTEQPSRGVPPLPRHASLLHGCSLADDALLRPLLDVVPARIRQAAENLNASFVGDLRHVRVGDFLKLHGISADGVRLLRAALACDDAAPVPPPPAKARLPGPVLFDGTEYPDWFWATALRNLLLTPLIAEALRARATLGDLRGEPEALLTSVPGLGPTAPSRLRGRVRGAYERAVSRRKPDRPAAEGADTDLAQGDAGPPVEAPVPAYDPATPLVAHIRQHLHLLHGREGEILSRHLGLSGRPETYEALAAAYGLSRSRIGQIKAKAMARLDAATGCLRTIHARIDALRGDGFIRSEAFSAEPWATDVPPWLLRTLCAELSDLHEVGLPWGGQAFVPIGTAAWEGYVQSLREGLRETLSATDPEAPAEAVAPLLLERATGEDTPRMAFLHLASDFLEGRTVLGAMVALGLSQEAALALIPRHGEPVSLDDILLKFARVSEHPPSRENLREWVTDLALHLGDNRYVLRTEVPGGEALARRCHALLSAGIPGRIWSTREMLDALASTGEPLPPDLDLARLELALTAADVLERVHPLRWRDPAARPARTVELLAESILEAHGAPMSHAELGRAAFARWGSRKSNQLRMTGRLVMLGDGLWGLVDRDLGLQGDPEAVAEAAMDLYRAGTRDIGAIFGLLRARGAHGGLANAERLASLLRLRKGLACGVDGCLKDPSQPKAHRPGTVPHAVLEVLAQAAEGLSVREAVPLVQALTGHLPQSSYVHRLLSRYGHRGTGGKWFKDPQPGNASERPEAVMSVAEEGRQAARKRSYPSDRRPASGTRDGSRWTPSDVGTLKAMWGAGATALSISIALDNRVSRSSVLSKIHRLGLQRGAGEP